MKKFIMASAVLAMLMSCGGGDSSKDKEVKKEETADASKDPDYQKGLDLIAQSDCLTCHKIDEKLQGPAYREVAEKYAGMGDSIVAHLADKIISGGTGVWGEIPMTPHPALSKDDAKAMVKYILLLKK